MFTLVSSNSCKESLSSQSLMLTECQKQPVNEFAAGVGDQLTECLSGVCAVQHLYFVMKWPKNCQHPLLVYNLC